MEVFFCDRCSCRITEGELEEHLAVRCGGLYFCQRCWREPEVREAVAKVTGKLPAVDEAQPEPRKTPPRNRPPTPRSLRPQRDGERRTPKGMNAVQHGPRWTARTTVAALGGVAGALAGFLVVAILSGNTSAASSLQQTWMRTSGANEYELYFLGRFLLDRRDTGIVIFFPSEGRWTVYTNGRLICTVSAKAGTGLRLGSDALVQGWNELRLCVVSPPGGPVGLKGMPRVERP